MKEDMVYVKDAVEYVLSKDKRARNDDKWLIIQTLQEMGFKIYIPFDRLNDIPSFESITRCRRKFQEQGMYLADAEIQEGREINRRDMQRIDEWLPVG